MCDQKEFTHLLGLIISEAIWCGTILLECESNSTKRFISEKHLVWKHVVSALSFQLDLGQGYFTSGFGLKGAQ